MVDERFLSSDVAGTARLLYSLYPQAAADLARARGRLADLRGDVAFMERYQDDWRNAVKDAERDESGAIERCEQCAQQLNKLAVLTARQFPNLWPELRLVSLRIGSAAWHEKTEFDWDAGVGELRRIEAAALIETAASTKKTGLDAGCRATVTVGALILDLIQRDPEARGLTAKEIARRIGRSKTSVIESQTWKELSEFRNKMRAERAADRHRK
ncbi:MAG TPA: hypothetical protein VJL29_00665 [Thermoguttaceae bacterium]|nr:hypothetical protein [Thermoguttaceae bacterium]